MSFQPIIPLSGYAGWSFLTRTMERQQTAFTESVPVKRATDYFRENIAKAKTAEALVNDRRLLEVALGAFGLDDDINAKAFIKKVLEDGTIKEGALSSRLADKRYAQFSQVFGYGNLGAETGYADFADKIIARYEARQFEIAVGEQDGTMRQALNLNSALTEVVAQNASINAQWFALMGNPSLRNTMEVALGLPTSFGTLDIDKQLGIFKDRAQSAFGTSNLAELAADDKREDVIRLFLVRSDILASSASYSPAQMALNLLQAG